MISVLTGCGGRFRLSHVLSTVQTSCMLYSSEPPETPQAAVAARLPCRVKVTGGKRYSWCSCGHSNKQPFCDGAHKTKAPSFKPLRFSPDKDRTLMLCACKQSRDAPYCDGTHFKVIFTDIVKSVKKVFKS